MAQHKLYLNVLWSDEHGGYVAVITRGQHRLGDVETIVLDVTVLPTKRACRKWFRRMIKERPWEKGQSFFGGSEHKIGKNDAFIN